MILVTAHASIDLAVESMKQGAQDFITKPMDYPKLRAILKAAESDIKRGKPRGNSPPNWSEDRASVNSSAPAKPCAKSTTSFSLSSSDASAIITGESGTGKELAARTIHRLSTRADGPFIPVNSAAIPETLIESEVFGHEKGAFTGAVGIRPGCFELANGGTLFLDEIGEMPLQLQPKLLRVLEDGKVRRLGGKQEFDFNVRVIAATNQEPRKLSRTEGCAKISTTALPFLRSICLRCATAKKTFHCWRNISSASSTRNTAPMSKLFARTLSKC